ncbi:IS66 family transposase [Leptospira inadai]|uniref:IS66 family transposase n=1 Tax=Leptospira inadai serovar Lyme TaxID=293084 RepID=A0ABX4YLY5_9LEPT|nr:IS66 family transposase [Leptospira inadai]PNV76231.1 IS66 family transposase [Leptospira inadai serovar Lyme]
MSREELLAENEELKVLLHNIQKDNASLRSKISSLENLVLGYRKELYGSKSEKIDPSEILQGKLFNEIEESQNDSPGLYNGHADEKVEVHSHTRKKPGRKPIPDHIPREEIIHDIPESEKICNCGQELSRIGEETSEKLDIIPQKVFVVKHIRYKYACKHCNGDERNEAGSVIKTAPLPPQLLPQSIATPGLVAYLLTSKFVDHLPFYRMEKIFRRMGLELPRSTMCNWTKQVYEKCKPFVSILKQQLLEGSLIGIDETTLQVMKEPNRSNTTKSYMWLFRGGHPEKPVLLYLYRETRSAEFIPKFLNRYQGCIQTDAFSSYDSNFRNWKGVLHGGCFAHARRKFYSVWQSEEDRIAGYVILRLREVYAVEKEIRKQKLHSLCLFSKIQKIREEKSKPILDDLKTFLDSAYSQVLPKSPIGEAIRYTLNEWERLTIYLSHGEFYIDNNLVENGIRPFVIGRKNWLFSGSPDGAEASTFFFSIVQTAIANKKDPYAVLRTLFEGVPASHLTQDFESLFSKSMGWV